VNSLRVHQTGELREAVTAASANSATLVALEYAAWASSSTPAAWAVRSFLNYEQQQKAAVESRVKVGDPRDPATTVGPTVSQTQWDRVQGYLRLGVEEGAAILVGGEGKPEGLSGYFVRPTVFTGVANDMRIAREEIFGPVMCVIPYSDEDEAIAIANDTTYGLSAYVFGEQAHAERIATRLESGRVVINGADHEPLAPFGGVKQSGLDRENGVFGLEAYLEPKTVLGSRAE
jgi:aldehyde dehydrogenase (NAD+)